MGIAAKDKLIGEQTKLITSLAHQVEKAGQKREEKREEFEATKTKFWDLETRSRWCPPSWCRKCLLDKCWCPPSSVPDLVSSNPLDGSHLILPMVSCGQCFKG